MGTLLNRRRYMGGKSLPYDAEVEYLKSNGAQYIETGILPNSTTRAQCGFQCAFINNAIFGSRDREEAMANDFDAIAYDYNEYGLIWRFNSGNITFNGQKPYTNKRYDIDMGNTYCVIDGHKYLTRTTNLWQAEVSTLTLFARKVPTLVYGAVSIFYFKLFEGDNILLDLIPVRVGNVGYMYDRVSTQLFGNAGTGEFILGHDKKIKDININVKTHSIGGSDASLYIITEYEMPVNILYTTVSDTPWNNEHINVKYLRTKERWEISAITPCLYDGQVYNSGDVIATWAYTETKDINIIANYEEVL